MIKSMTGFARAEASGEWGRAVWELRSVNHRYLDISFRLPEEMRGLEQDLRQAVAACVRRGKLEIGFRFTAQGAAIGEFSVDQQRLTSLKAAVAASAEVMGDMAAPDPMRVLAWPGVVNQQAPDLSALQAAARELFNSALAQLDATRIREGEQLEAVICERCELLEQGVSEVRMRYPQVRDAWRDKLQQRCADLGVDVDPGRLEQELAMAAQRLDVEEELQRLSGHVSEVRKALKRKEAIGRRLDFLMQELNREANTLSSKSQDGDMTRVAVEMKVAIEQMREQVQNIE